MIRLKPGANYFWKMHHPGIGIRIPEIVLPGIIAALQKYRTGAGLELSFGRETSLAKIIKARAGKYPITLGHTGTSIPAYLKAAEKAATVAGIPVELEADHLIVIGSHARAVKRIEGVFEKRELDPRQLKASFDYNFAAIDQALTSADVRGFTTDTSDFIFEDAESLSSRELESGLHNYLSERGRRRLFRRYLDKKFKIVAEDGHGFTLEFDREKVIRLFLKYRESIRGNARLYDYLRVKKLKTRSFGYEISLDETPYLTPLDEAFFYLMEWTGSNRHFDYLAPNIGFTKRADYTGSIKTLAERVRNIAAVANYFDEGIISFHSGSGSNPWSGKGDGVYPVLLEATGSRLKYKISGVYFELLLELLARGAGGKPGRELYNEIFDRVYEYCREQVLQKGELASELLQKQLSAYEKEMAQKKCQPRNPRADFFRFNSWLALAFRDEKARRIYRQNLVQLYGKSASFREEVDQEVFALTERLITGLKFEANY